jgi:hypothetical protein
MARPSLLLPYIGTSELLTSRFKRMSREDF